MQKNDDHEEGEYAAELSLKEELELELSNSLSSLSQDKESLVDQAYDANPCTLQVSGDPRTMLCRTEQSVQEAGLRINISSENVGEISSNVSKPSNPDVFSFKDTNDSFA
jgi:hypothetical protein